MARLEFSSLVKRDAFMRSNGRCECGCGRKILGTPEYHHAVPAAIGGEATLENCVVMDPKCHRVRTARLDVPQIAKTKRIYAKRTGSGRTKRTFPGGKGSRWKKKVDGTTIPRFGSWRDE